MAEDKEIRIRAVLDASTFDKGINEIQEKLRRITQQQAQATGARQNLGKDSVMGKYAQQAFGDFSKESQRQLEQMYQVQRREAVNQSITMKGKQQELEKMLKIDGELTKQQQQRLEFLKKEIDLLKEKHRQTLTTAAETQKALDKMGGGAGGAGGGGTPPGGGPTPPGPSGPGMFSALIKQIGVAAIIKGVVNAAATGVQDYISRDRKIAMNNAATMNIGSREMREGMSGQGSRGMFWNAERARAMQAAANEQQNQQGWNTVKAWGGTALQGIGIGTMALTGWTGIGLGIGAGIAGAGTALKGGIIGDETSRAAMFDREKFRSMMTKEGMEKYEQNLAAEKAKNPRKAMAREYFEQNRDDLLSMQKMAGLGTDAELMGEGGVGILQRNMKYGGQFGGVNFSQQTIQDQMAALSQGGAMTEGIRDLSGAAATYNRQFNLSNAGGVMGKIQGNTGMNSSLTDMAYQRLMTEAVRLGVDTSTMPREMEKMTQMAAELSTAGGVNATGMADLFSGAIGGFNQKALQSAASAAEDYKDTSKGAAGWEGQMGFGFLQSKKAKDLLGGKQLSAKQMNTLNQTSAAELDEEGFARMAAVYTDGDVDKMKQLLQEKDKFKQGRTDTEDKAYQDLQAYFKESGADTVEKRRAALQTDKGRKLYEAARTERGATHGDFLQKSQVQQESEILLQAAPVGPSATDLELMDSEAGKKVAAQKGKKETRAAAVEEGAIATGDMARIEALNENLEGFKKAAAGYTKYAVEYNTQFELMVEATKKGATSMTDIANHLSALEKKMADDAAQNGAVPGAKPASGATGDW
jgi:hypothetical protein